MDRIDYDKYGKIENEKWLYKFHPSVKNYLDNLMRIDLESQQEYSEKLSEYYSKLLDETYTEFGKENMFSSVMCFNIILEGENNDFERSIELTKDPYLTAYNSRILGLILYKQGLFTKSLKFLPMP